MIRTLVVFLYLTGLLTACAGPPATLPQLTQVSPQPAECPTLFPQGNYQFVHLIEFSMPGGHHGTAMGVTVIKDHSIESVLMTVEGFVLFSARLTDTLQVDRAVPPFDKPGFAEGMMEDIKAIFLPAQGTILGGEQENRQEICRTVTDSLQTVDIHKRKDNCLELFMYSAEGELQTTITGQSCPEKQEGLAVPGMLTLQSLRLGGYQLQMSLVSVEER